MSSSPPGSRAQPLEIVRRFGRTTTSFQTLELGMSHWYDGEGCIGFVDTGGAWVAAGEPIGPTGEVAGMAQRFIAAARAAGRRPSFFSVACTAGDWDDRLAILPIGREPWWRLSEWPELASSHRSIGGQVKRALKAGVSIVEIDPEQVREQTPAREALDCLIDEWVGERPMPAMEFLVDLQPWSNSGERIYFAARREGRWIALIVAVPIYGRDAWFIEDLIRSEAAPNGTSEALIDAVMREALRRGAREATMGLAPLAGTELWQRAVRSMLSDFYPFGGIHRFKSKLCPSRWEDVYLAYPASTPVPVAIFDVLNAFAPGHIVRFALASVFRTPRFSIRLIAVLLIPWVGFLVWADPTRWFPSRRVRNYWVIFDLIMAAGLFRLLERWDDRLVAALLAGVAGDAVLSTRQVVQHNLPRSRGVWGRAFAVALVAAPVITAVVLWQEGKRRRAKGKRKKARESQGDRSRLQQSPEVSAASRVDGNRCRHLNRPPFPSQARV